MQTFFSNIVCQSWVFPSILLPQENLTKTLLCTTVEGWIKLPWRLDFSVNCCKSLHSVSSHFYCMYNMQERSPFYSKYCEYSKKLKHSVCLKGIYLQDMHFVWELSRLSLGSVGSALGTMQCQGSSPGLQHASLLDYHGINVINAATEDKYASWQ